MESETGNAIVKEEFGLEQGLQVAANTYKEMKIVAMNTLMKMKRMFAIQSLEF